MSRQEEKPVAVLMLAAGRGSRLTGADGPKQYQLLEDRCILQHAIDCFKDVSGVKMIQPVIHSDDLALFEKLITSEDKLLPPVFGGDTRQQSTLNGLLALQNHSVDGVLIHDAARPFTTPAIIKDVIDAIGPNICALPTLPIVDTLKKLQPAASNNSGITTVSREGLYAAQTPQGFLFEQILEAHQLAANETDTDFTDDASIAEWNGMAIKQTRAEPDNYKITTNEDLMRARRQLSTSALLNREFRTGIGYDVHRLIKGDGIILCGHKIASDIMLDGHSDADVAMHAITDALLGTIGSGDIGSHFPPNDPHWKGASSDLFLKHACKLLAQAGGRIINLDVTIICEEPKVGPHRQIMRANISEICDTAENRVSIKATTHEKIGTLGRGEGIAALATVSVEITNAD